MSKCAPAMDFEELASGEVVVRGSLDLSTVECLRRKLQDLSKRSRDVTMRLDGVTFADSSALRVLVAAAQTLRRAGGRFQIVAVSAAVLKTMSLLHLDWVLG